MEHPYKSLQPSAFWRRAVADVPLEEVDPFVEPRFKIDKQDRVVTAGSCFAQHLARHLAREGFTYHVTESAHPFIHKDSHAKYNYGIFSARYGNLYTPKQLLQLALRAYGKLKPETSVWRRADGRLVDPFRPEISPDGYATEHELVADQYHHLLCVRKAIEEASVFVFTLGLTEGWRSRKDGAIFPICPGVVAGDFDPLEYEFVNFKTSEIVQDMLDFKEILGKVNPGARLLLTVSPVPLVATASGKHVLYATTASKSILRAACAELDLHHDTEYFPSYEIITGSYTRGKYFATDLRSVTEDGVAHVMRSFIRHYASDTTGDSQDAPEQQKHSRSDMVEHLMNVVCEEEALDRGQRPVL